MPQRTFFITGANSGFGFAIVSAAARAGIDAAPDKLAAAVLTLIASEDPPLRLLRGSDALNLVSERIDLLRRELAAWETLTLPASDLPPHDSGAGASGMTISASRPSGA